MKSYRVYKNVNKQPYIMGLRLSLFYLYILLLIIVIFLLSAGITFFKLAFYTVWVKPAIPIIGGLVLIVGALANIGKVLGDSRDYRGFITSIVLYLAVYFCLVGIVAFIMAG